MNWSADTATDWTDELHKLAGILRYHGITRVDSFAWRDLADPDAGGSEVHADEVLTRWAAAGIAVHHRTSTDSSPEQFRRNGYEVTRSGGRYTVFARVIASRLLRRADRTTATVEIWNGVPWFSQLWGHKVRSVWLHHIHEDMWKESVPALLAPIARMVEVHLAPRFYRRTNVATLAVTTKRELTARGYPDDRLWVAEPGIDPRYVPRPTAKTPHPSLVAVGRLAPVKRFAELLDQFAIVARDVPQATLTIAGDGPDMAMLRDKVRELGLDDRVRLAGRVSDDELLHLYQSSWLLVSASHSEGWGMTITEAAACATPCVVTRNHGHEAAAVDGETGTIVDRVDQMAPAITSLISDAARLDVMSAGARASANRYSWDRTATILLATLVDSIPQR
jgi:glycosyltransferase involved in cell wall biosynthesis